MNIENIVHSSAVAQEQLKNHDKQNPIHQPMKKSKSLKLEKQNETEGDISFNESDIEAYQNECPIPVLKQAYLEFKRDKKKAALRRTRTTNSKELPEEPAELIVKKRQLTDYDNPDKRTIMAHDDTGGLLDQVEKGEGDQAYKAYIDDVQDGFNEVADKGMELVNDVGEVADQVLDGTMKGAQDLAEGLGDAMEKGLGMLVPNHKVIEDVDKYRYDVSDNRRIQQVAVSRVFKKAGRYIFQLGTVNFLEQTILNLFLVIYCWQRETALQNEVQLNPEYKNKVKLPYIRTHVSRIIKHPFLSILIFTVFTVGICYDEHGVQLRLHYLSLNIERCHS